MRMTYGLTALALAALIQAAPAAAQSGALAKPMGKDKVYTGCLAAGATAGSFTLEHATEVMAMGKDAMGKDSMSHDAMGKGMADHKLALSSTAVDLSKHVGHQVSVTVRENAMAKPDTMGKPDTMAKPDAMGKPGMEPMAAMTVSSLKMIAAKCSM